jgi:hypothetical protein
MKKVQQFTAFVGLMLLVFLVPANAAIMQVVAGSDYLATQPGTSFMGIPLNGDAFGPGNTDTHVVRLQNAIDSGGSGTIPIVMARLQLVTAMPVDLGLGTGLYFITLQSDHGGPASTGQMTINFNNPDDSLPNTPEGTFSSFFDIFFDIHFGSPTGPIAMTNQTPLVLTNQGALWDATPTPGDVIVNGPNGDLLANLHSGLIRNSDIYQMDFFPVGSIQESEPGVVHIVDPATPEPATFLLLGGGLAAVILARRRRRF